MPAKFLLIVSFLLLSGSLRAQVGADYYSPEEYNDQGDALGTYGSEDYGTESPVTIELFSHSFDEEARNEALLLERSCVVEVLLPEQSRDDRSRLALSDFQQVITQCEPKLLDEALGKAYQEAIDWDKYLNEIKTELDSLDKKNRLYKFNPDKIAILFSAFENRLIQKIYLENKKTLFAKSYEIGKGILQDWSREVNSLLPAKFPKKTSLYDMMVAGGLAVLDLESPKNNQGPLSDDIKGMRKQLDTIVLKGMTEFVKTNVKQMIEAKWGEKNQSTDTATGRIDG